MSIDQEMPPAKNEITSKDSSTAAQNLTQNTAANKPETGSKTDSVSSVPQAENDATSQNSTLPPNEGVRNPKEEATGTLKQGSASHEIKPAENETSKDSDNTNQAAETSKQEPDHTENVKKDADDVNISKISSPPNDDLTQASSIGKQEDGGTKTSGQDSNPSVQKIPSAQDESASQNPPPPEDNVSQTTEIRSQVTENTEASRQDSASLAGPSVQQIPPVQDESASQNPLPPQDNVSQTTKIRSQETEDTEASRQDLASLADPSVQQVPPAQDESASQNPLPPEDNVSQTTEIRSQETEDTEASRQDSASLADPSVQQVPPAQDESASQNPLPPEDNVSETTEIRSQEIEDTEASRQDSASLADPNVQQIPPVQDESASQNPISPENNVSQTTEIGSQETEDTEASRRDSTTLADPSVQQIPPAQDESTSQNPLPSENNVSQTTEIRSKETEDNDASRQDSASLAGPQPVNTTLAENETISKKSSPPQEDVTQSTETRNQEIDAIEDHPHEQDVTPSENEATARHASSPNNIPTQSMATGTPKKVPNQDTTTKDADFHSPVNEISPDEKVKKVKRYSSLPTGSGNDADSRPEKSSRWKTFCRLFPLFKRRKDSSPKPLGVSPTTKSETSTTSSSEVKALPNLISADLESVEKEILALKEYNDRLIGLNKDAREEFSQKEGNHSELRKSMIKLKLLIPSQSNVDSDAFKDLQLRLKARESIPPDFLEKMPRLHNNDIFYCSPEMNDFEVLYKRLESSKLRICLLCFSIFPGNETIRKRLMTWWWATEGLSSEEEAEQHFRKLREEGFIVPVNNNISPFVGRYRMHTLYQSMLKILAEKAKFFNFDKKGEPTQNYKNSFQACLVGEGLLSYDDMKKGSMTVNDLEKIHLVVNVNEPILDFKPNWFSMMKNVNVLYLGRWQASDAAHIEVEETDFLDGLKNINSIKFLSLQGISNIITLTESILALKRLEFLDLRACHNLEAIPSRIGSLTCLTHLDISECYLLDHMPKSLSELKNLRVFKGFVVKGRNYKNSCTLADLKELKNLTKLCIYTTWNHFPDETQVRFLEGMSKLLKLTIAWGGEALKAEIGGDTSNPSEVGGETSTAKIEGGTSNPSEAGEDASKGKKASKLPSQLTKLDLKCFPLKATPSWLDIANLENLRKLYIRGGRFSDLGQYQCTDSSDTSLHKKDVWKVKVLRLKYLSNLEMEWRQLHELFPDLMYLEKISCPKLTLFNCGACGVWINPTKLKAWEKEVQLMQPQTNPAWAD